MEFRETNINQMDLIKHTEMRAEIWHKQEKIPEIEAPCRWFKAVWALNKVQIRERRKERKEGREGDGEGDCQTCSSQAGLRGHLLLSFEGVVMVTVAGSRGWERLHGIPVASDVAQAMMGKLGGDLGDQERLGTA